MFKRGIGFFAVVAAGALALAAPVGAEQGGHHGQAVRAAAAACKQERKDLGREAFANRYGKHAMKACLNVTVGEARNAAQECRAERDDIGADAFRDEYGTNHNGRNAFGKCVSDHVNGDDEESGDDAGATCEETGGAADDGAVDDEGGAAAKPHGEHGSSDEDCSTDEGAADDGSADDGAADDDAADDGAADDGSADDGAAGDAV